MSAYAMSDRLTCAGLLRFIAADQGRAKPLEHSLSALAATGGDRSTVRRLKRALRALEQGEKPGRSLLALKGFDPALAELVDRAGQGAELQACLVQAADLLEEGVHLHPAVRVRRGYYLLLLVFATLVFYFAGVFILPQYQELYADTGVSLPLLTAWLLDMSQWMSGAGMLVPVAVAAFLLFGPLAHAGTSPELLGLFRRLELLARQGVQKAAAVDLAADASRSRAGHPGIWGIARRIEPMRRALHTGRYSARLKGLPPDCLDLLRAGASDDPETWGLVAGQLRRRLELEAKRTGASPADLLVVVLLGGMIGLLVIGLYLPLFGMAGLVS